MLLSGADTVMFVTLFDTGLMSSSTRLLTVLYVGTVSNSVWGERRATVRSAPIVQAGTLLEGAHAT